MNTITIPKTEYQELKRQAKQYHAIVSVPSYQLKGQAAKRLDRRVVSSLKGYQAGKYKPIRSLADLL